MALLAKAALLDQAALRSLKLRSQALRCLPLRSLALPKIPMAQAPRSQAARSEAPRSEAPRSQALPGLYSPLLQPLPLLRLRGHQTNLAWRCLADPLATDHLPECEPVPILLALSMLLALSTHDRLPILLALSTHDQTGSTSLPSVECRDRNRDRSLQEGRGRGGAATAVSEEMRVLRRGFSLRAV